jgi:predicted ATPase/DNA-binding CsgD family transcriptional regulator
MNDTLQSIDVKQTERLIGRENESRLLRTWLLNPEVRLITVTGPPGVGKSYLSATVAQSVAEHFKNGFQLIHCGECHGWGTTLRFVAEAVGLKVAPKQGADKTAPRLFQELEGKNILLFFDDFEHLKAAATSHLQAFLLRCKGLTLLVTSRERLGLPDEHVLDLQPFRLSEHEDQVETAQQTFVHLAQRELPGFTLLKKNTALVEELCHQLDGLPFALSLATTQLSHQSLESLTRDLRGPDLPNWEADLGSPYRTLGELFERSYQLLSPPERKVLRHASIFTTTFITEALNHVVGDKTHTDRDVYALLMGLVSKHLTYETNKVGNTSLLQKGQESFHHVHRFSLLRLVKRFAYEKLVEAGELPLAQARLVDFYQQLLEGDVKMLEHRTSWVIQEYNNLRAVFEFSQDYAKIYQDKFMNSIASLSVLLNALSLQLPPALTPERPVPKDLLNDIQNVLLPLMNPLYTKMQRLEDDSVKVAVTLTSKAPGEVDETVLGPLTEREQEVLQYLVKGLSNREIAEQLVISPRTVGTHLSSIFSKLNVKTRTAAVRKVVASQLDPSQ